MNRVLTRGARGKGWRIVGLVAAAASVLSFGCGGKALDVGSDSQASGGGGGGGGAAAAVGGGGHRAYAPGTCDVSQAPAPEWPKAADCLPASDSPLVGVWRGHWPDPTALNNNQDATLRIAGLTAQGTPCGTLTVGEGPELPTPTDATEYPPYGANGGGGGPASGLSSGKSYPFSGHAYPIMNVESSGARLAFGYAFTDPWRSWCGLQAQAPGTELCVNPETASITPDGRRCFSGKQEISCAQYLLCAREQMCRCNAACCDAQTNGSVSLELHWDDDALEGTVTVLSGPQPIFLDPVPAP